MDIIFLLAIASGLIVLIFIVALLKHRSVKGSVINLSQHGIRSNTRITGSWQ
jgi:hypothetical protein